MPKLDIFTVEFSPDRIARFVYRTDQKIVKINELVIALIFARLYQRATKKDVGIAFELTRPPRDFVSGGLSKDLSDEDAIKLFHDIAQDSEIDFLLTQDHKDPAAFQLKRFLAPGGRVTADELVEYIKIKISEYGFNIRPCIFLISVESIEPISEGVAKLVSEKLVTEKNIPFKEIFFVSLEDDGSVTYGKIYPEFSFRTLKPNEFI